MSESDVDDILCDLDGHGNTGCTLDLTGNDAPSAAGEACIDNLRADGWTVSVHGGY